jgi:predicted dehydrogenase
LTFLTGQPCTAVSASALQSAGKPVSDVVTLTAEFANGSLGTIHYYANGHPSLPKELIEVHGGGVSARLENFRSLKLYGTKATGRKYYFNQVKGYAEEAAAFVQAVRHGTAAPIPFDHLYATCKATLCVEQSILTGRRLAC